MVGARKRSGEVDCHSIGATAWLGLGNHDYATGCGHTSQQDVAHFGVCLSGLGVDRKQYGRVVPLSWHVGEHRKTESALEDSSVVYPAVAPFEKRDSRQPQQDAEGKPAE